MRSKTENFNKLEEINFVKPSMIVWASRNRRSHKMAKGPTQFKSTLTEPPLEKSSLMKLCLARMRRKAAEAQII